MTGRVQVDTVARLRSPIFANGDGVKANPSPAPTCTVTSHRLGSAVSDTVTNAGTGDYYAEITAPALPDLLTVEWTDGTSTWTSETKVVTAHLAGLVELRDALTQKPSAANDARRLEALRDEFTDRVMEYRGESWATEYAVETLTVPEGGQRICGTLGLPHCVNVALVSVTDPDDTVVTSDWYVTSHGRLSAPTVTLAEGTWTFAYTHGVNEPWVLNRACVDWVTSMVRRGDAGTARDIIWQGTDGTVRYSTPDASAGRPTGLMDVDAVLSALPDHRQVLV